MYRDPVRSSHGHFVKAKGLRRVSLMLRAEIPWAHRVWALPFLTVPAPSRHYHEARGRRHKTITDWARQMLCVLRRGLPDRELVVVGDRTYATLKLRAACQGLNPPVTFPTRLRLDAVLPDPPAPPGRASLGGPRVVGARQPSLQARLADPATVWTDLRQRWLLLRDPTGHRDPQALLCTNPDGPPTAILATCQRCRQVEAAFLEVRTHLGVETQHQWSAQAPPFSLSPATPDIRKRPQPPPAPLLAALCYSA